MDIADVGVIQGGGGLGFLEEPLRGVVFGQVRGQELDGDGALEAWVSGLIDDAHAAAAELGDDLVDSMKRLTPLDTW